MAYTIHRGGMNEMDLIKPLWEKLNTLHENCSPHFSSRFQNMSWEIRKKKLLAKSEKLLLDYVVDNNSGFFIGYCISTIDKNDSKTGEIDSIFIEKEHRKSGIGNQLMDMAIQWLIEEGTDTQRLVVGVGNEKVIDFYEQFGFYPVHIMLQRK